MGLLTLLARLISMILLTSRFCTKMIAEAIMGHVCDNTNQMHEAKKEQKPALSTSQQGTLESILTSLSSDKKHAVQRAVESN